MVPGAMFSTVTSAFVKSSLTSSSPRGVLRLIVIDRLLALNMWKYQGSSSGLPGRSRRPGSPVFGFSILTTSAPSHASASVHDVPASNCVKSTIRMPARQLRSWALSLIAGLPPVEGAPDGNSAPDALEHLDRVVRELKRWHRDGARLQLVAGGTIAHHLVQGLRHQLRVVRLVAERVHELVGRDDLGHAGAVIADSLGRVDGQLDGQADVRPEQLARSVGLGAGPAVHGRPGDGGIGPDADERTRAVQRERDRDALAAKQGVELTHRLPARGGPVGADVAEFDADSGHADALPASSYRRANDEQGDARQGERDLEGRRAVTHRHGALGLELLETLALFDRPPLVGRRIWGRAERAPHRVAVAVRGVDPPVAHPGAAAERQALEPQGDGGVAGVERILVVGVAPDEHAHASAVDGGARVDFLRHASRLLVRAIRRPRPGGFDGQARRAQGAQHPIGVQDRLLDPLRGEEAARALEESLALEIEAPGGRLVDAGPATGVEVEELLHQLALECRE